MHMLILFLELSFFSLVVYFLQRKKPVELFSPVYIFLFYYVFIFSFGWLLSPLDFSAGGVSADIILTEYDYRITFLYGMSVVIFFTMGALFQTYLSRYRWVKKDRNERFRTIFFTAYRSETKEKYPKTILALIFLLGVIVFVFILIGVGPSNIWLRDVYLPVEVRGAKIIGFALTPFVVMLLGYSFLRVKHLYRSLILIMMAMYFVLYFALASRWFAFMLVLFMLGVLMCRPSSKKIKLLVVFSAIFAFLLLLVPLSLRALEAHGLYPYFLAVIGDSVIIDWGQLEKMTNNLLFSYSLTGHIIMYENIDIKHLMISINPLPGSLVGWYESVDVLRVNPYTPFNAPGELLNHGVLYAAVFYFMLGVYFSSLDNKINQYLTKNKLLLSALLVGLAVLYTISSLQYNLRSGLRLIYYIIAFQLVVFMLCNSKKYFFVKINKRT